MFREDAAIFEIDLNARETVDSDLNYFSDLPARVLLNGTEDSVAAPTHVVHGIERITYRLGRFLLDVGGEKPGSDAGGIIVVNFNQMEMVSPRVVRARMARSPSGGDRQFSAPQIWKFTRNPEETGDVFVSMENEIETAPTQFAKKKAGIVKTHEAVLQTGDRIAWCVRYRRGVMMDDRDLIQEAEFWASRLLVDLRVKLLQIGRLHLASSHHLRQGVGINGKNGQTKVRPFGEHFEDKRLFHGSTVPLQCLEA
ncbi:MAG TPA: hypothetical protein VH157_05120 [Bryobacteraceae bacterium]|nr:hypothetical protein [Bryobacteraceae bacterium]